MLFKQQRLFSRDVKFVQPEARSHESGQIGSRPHTTDGTPQMVGLVREIPGYFREI